MKPFFSFTYRGKRFHASEMQGEPCGSGVVYEIESGVRVHLEASEYPEFDALEWVLYFENGNAEDSGVFSDILDCDAHLPLKLPAPPAVGHRPVDGNLSVITMNGSVSGNYYWENDAVSGSEFALMREYLDKNPGKPKAFANKTGRASDGTVPIFDLTASDSGYIAAIGWTGDWKAEFCSAEGGATVKTGLKETNFYLKSGERLRTSSTLLMRYGAEEDKSNKFRRLIKTHFSHKTGRPDKRDALLAFEFWGGLPSETMKRRLGELKAHGIRFEDVWIDAGWYGDCTKCDEPFSGDWSEKTGDWTVNTRVHPQGLRDVSEAAKDAGMRLMLWFEPERAIRGTRIAEEHPEWFLTLPNDSSMILNYGNDQARSYICELLLRYVKELDLSCYRQDFNVGLTEYFRASDEENRRGVTEIKHIMGMYALWDDLLKQAPHLLIDNCSSGGRRIDIETLRRSIPFFRSDYQCNFNANPEVLQAHNANASLYLPYNGCTSKIKSDTYAVRSSYSASWGGAFYNAVFQSMDEADFAWAKQIVEEYRSIRKYMSEDFYNHGSATMDASSWAIWQYHDPKTQAGIVLAFRREGSPFDRVSIKLKGLTEKSYEVTSLDSGETHVTGGALEITLPTPRTSVILEYKAASV